MIRNAQSRRARVRAGGERWRAAMLAGLAGLAGVTGAAGLAAAGQADATHAPPLVLPAHVVAYQAALITAKVAGFVKRIPVDKGDRIKVGALIAVLEVPELEADRVKYRAQLEVAERNFTRVQEAAKAAPDLVTPQQVDVERGRLEVARAEFSRIEALLRYARVTAPFSGTITARYVDPGAFVSVPTAGTPRGAAIVTLMSLSRVRVQIPVPENVAAQVRPGTAALISSPSLPGRHIRASVTRVSYALSRDSQTMLAEIDTANPGHELLPGMYVSVQLTTHPVRALAGTAAGVR